MKKNYSVWAHWEVMLIASSYSNQVLLWLHVLSCWLHIPGSIKGLRGDQERRLKCAKSRSSCTQLKGGVRKRYGETGQKNVIKVQIITASEDVHKACVFEAKIWQEAGQEMWLLWANTVNQSKNTCCLCKVFWPLSYSNPGPRVNWTKLPLSPCA